MVVTTPELTLTRLMARVARKMGWNRPEDWPSEEAPYEMANEAGEWLCDYGWSWLVRPPAALDLVQGQSFLNLPDDFATPLGKPQARAASPYTLSMETTVQVAAALSDWSGGTTSAFVGAYVGTGPTVAGPKSIQRIELGPVPTTSLTSAFTLPYLAGWTPVSDGGHHILVPSFMTGLYIKACCEYVAGLEHDDEASQEDRLDRLEGSALFRSAQARDGMLDPDLGPSRGGIGETFGGEDQDYFFRRYPGNIPIVSS